MPYGKGTYGKKRGRPKMKVGRKRKRIVRRKRKK
tara:strand:+ start:3371 stop:3472 length:102 start_codon:yes stop_codon:yes gene_type:complete